MKDRDIEKQIDALSGKICELRRKTEKSARWASIIYVLLVVFVFVYTAVIMSLLKSKATPDNVSAKIRIVIDRDLLTDANRQWVLSTCKKYAPDVAESLVRMTHEKIIPTMREHAKKLIDVQVDYIIEHFEKDVYPEVSRVVKEHAQALRKHSDIADEEVANELAKILASEFDREMGKYINDNLKKRIASLQGQFETIAAKPYDKLTLKEAAERRLIVNWVFLLEHHEAPEDILGGMLKEMNATYEEALKQLNLK